ncbi:MAG TPA: alkaline phosphatase family protein [Burkholderiales bacterium]|nr:alkaline phosphatase family protein [Burkholderiales bacterium]
MAPFEMNGGAPLPDYAGGGFVNLIASLVAGCGGEPRHPELRLLPAAEASGARNIVLAIVDGLGDNYLRTHGAQGTLARLRRGSISAVFPSTTASAITTSFTGATPYEHGLTGWFTYFGAAGCVAAPLPFRSRGDNVPLAARGISGSHLFSGTSLFDSIGVRGIVVTHRSIVNSNYNLHYCGRAERIPYADLRGFIDQTEAAVKSGPERKFIYTYWPEFDTLAHRHGVASPQVHEQFQLIDAAFSELAARLSGTDTLLVVTADHGFLDSTGSASLELEDAPGLASMLRFPLCGERRAAFCHVQEGRVPEFMARARDWLGERGEVHKSSELAEEGWFGTGRPHARLAERIADVTFLMNGSYTVKDWTPGEAHHLHIGNHGGTSEDEMRIPLVVAHA